MKSLTNYWPLIVLVFIECVIIALASSYYEPQPIEQTVDYLPLSQLYNFGYAVIVGPVFEEIAFRYWLKRKKNFLWFLSIILWLAYMALCSWVLFTIGCVTVLLVLSGRVKNFALFAVISASCFSFVHFDYLNFNWVSLLAWLDLFVFGLTMSYLYWKWNIGLSILVHVVFNAWVIFGVNGTELTLRNKHTTIHTPISTINLTKQGILEPYQSPLFKTDTGKVIRMEHVFAAEILKQLYPTQKETVFLYPLSENKYSLQLVAKNTWQNDTIWKQELKAILPVRLDTLKIETGATYTLSYDRSADSNFKYNDRRWNHRGSLRSVAEKLAQTYLIPISASDTTMLKVPISHTRTFQQAKYLLEKNYGVQFHEKQKKIIYVFVTLTQ